MSEQKIEAFWRDATAEDVARFVKGEKVEARFRDKTWHEWTASGELLAGYDSTEESKWIDDTGCPWKQCQVYDPQQWWLDRPDPGEGWRLLEKFPDEPKLATDEAWNWDDAKWQPIARGGEQEYAAWYRRRIEAVEPEPKHYVLRVGDSCETPCGNRIRVIPQGGTQRFFNLKAGDTIKTMHGQTITITEKGFEVL